MTAFQYFDLEQTMHGHLVDLPTFETYNVQYSSPTATLYYGTGSTSHHDAPIQQFGSPSASDEGSVTLDSDHGQGLARIHGAASSSTAAHSPRFWEHGVASGGNFEHAVCTPIDAGSTAGIPTSVIQWSTSHSQPSAYHTRASLIDLPQQMYPFQTSTYTADKMSTLAAAQILPQVPCIPIQDAPSSFRHATIFQPSTPSICTLENAVTTHKYAAHQPIPPECQSTYSTLAGNVEFLERLQLESRSPSFSICSQPQSSIGPPTSNKRQRSPSLTVPSQGYCQAERGTTHVPTQLVSTNEDSGRATSGPNSAKRARTEDQLALSSSSSSSRLLPLTPRSISMSGPSAVTIEEAPPVTKHPKNVKEPRKPSLACLFCRERKIGCGRPPEGSEDMTCNQCARRKFVCVYMTEKPPRVRRRSAKAKSPTE